jgi:hypothetical protein
MSSSASGSGITERRRTRWAAVLLDHPRALGEGYWEHQRHALHFGSALLAAGLACIVHAWVPALFPRTGSTAVARLYSEMTALRRVGGTGHRPTDTLGREPLAS